MHVRVEFVVVGAPYIPEIVNLCQKYVYMCPHIEIFKLHLRDIFWLKVSNIFHFWAVVLLCDFGHT